MTTMRYAILLLLLLAGCDASDETATRVLSAQGFTDVKLGGYPLFSCSKGDNFNREFTARNVRGDTVKGAVCCGVFKNCTVRFD